MNKTEMQFIDRHNELVSEIRKFDEKEQKYNAWLDKNFYEKYDSMNEAQKDVIRHHIQNVILWDWIYDRQRELREALDCVDSEYHSWHFQQYGWAAI